MPQPERTNEGDELARGHREIGLLQRIDGPVCVSNVSDRSRMSIAMPVVTQSSPGHVQPSPAPQVALEPEQASCRVIWPSGSRTCIPDARDDQELTIWSEIVQSPIRDQSLNRGEQAKTMMGAANRLAELASPCHTGKTRGGEANIERILDAALAIFAMMALPARGSTPLPSARGSPKPNLLYYFRTKADLYLAVLRRTLDMWLCRSPRWTRKAILWRR